MTNGPADSVHYCCYSSTLTHFSKIWQSVILNENSEWESVAFMGLRMSSFGGQIGGEEEKAQTCKNIWKIVEIFEGNKGRRVYLTRISNCRCSELLKWVSFSKCHYLQLPGKGNAEERSLRWYGKIPLSLVWELTREAVFQTFDEKDEIVRGFLKGLH